MARMSIIGTLAPGSSKGITSNRRTWLWTVMLVFFCSNAFATGYVWLENNLKARIPSIYIDYWTGLDDSGKGYACLFIEMSPLDMQFLQSEAGFAANYRLEIGIWDERQQRVKQKVLRDSVVVKDYSDAKEYNWNRLYRAAFELPDGRYQAMIRILDTNSNRSALLQQELLVQNEPVYGLNASDILVARRDIYEDDPRRQNVGILPFPGKIFGEAQSEVFYYFEVYSESAAPTDSADYTTYCVGPDNFHIPLESGRVGQAGGKIPILHSIPVSEYPPGYYDLIVEVSAVGSQVQIERRQRFSVYQNPLNLKYKAYEDILGDLSFMAGEEEITRLRNVSQENRQAALYRFWKERDPTPASAKNELFLEFYERLYIAKRLYSRRNEGKSIITDQGKVFMMLGAPDEVLNFEDRAEASDTQVWKYDAQQLKVVFRDDAGSGNFRLISPYSLLEDE